VRSALLAPGFRAAEWFFCVDDDVAKEEHKRHVWCYNWLIRRSKESGYDHKLTYNPEPTPRNKRKRKRNITWYNLPFDSNVKTNLGRKFIHIVDKCFQKNHRLYKIFNRQTLKLSYSCMTNGMKSIISSHNKHVFSNANAPTPQPDTCNCRKKSDCPLEGKCLQTNAIYQATVTTETTTETYVGLATNFKERYRNHKTSFRHVDTRTEKMRQSSPNMFGTYKTQRNRFW